MPIVAVRAPGGREHDRHHLVWQGTHPTPLAPQAGFSEQRGCTPHRAFSAPAPRKGTSLPLSGLSTTFGD